MLQTSSQTNPANLPLNTNQMLISQLKTLITPLSIFVILLVLLNTSSAIGVIFIKNQNRALSIEMQKLKSAERKLNMEHSQLLLEQSAWMAQDRISSKAKTDFNMHAIKPEDMKIIKLKNQRDTS